MMRRSCRSFITALALVAAACGSQRLTVLRAREPAEDTAQIDSLTVENAARLVATTRDRKLVLSGLTTLSADVATALAALANFAGMGIMLGLDELPPTTARTLATFKARRLRSQVRPPSRSMPPPHWRRFPAISCGSSTHPWN